MAARCDTSCSHQEALFNLCLQAPEIVSDCFQISQQAFLDGAASGWVEGRDSKMHETHLHVTDVWGQRNPYDVAAPVLLSLVLAAAVPC